jgi:hypothetical protein
LAKRAGGVACSVLWVIIFICGLFSRIIIYFYV